MLQQERDAQVQVARQVLQRIAGHKGVIGYIVLNPRDGAVLECVGFAEGAAPAAAGGASKLADVYADKLFGLCQLAQSTVRTLDRDDALTFLRLRFRLREALVAPDPGNEYVLVVVQDQQPPEPASAPSIADPDSPVKGRPGTGL